MSAELVVQGGAPSVGSPTSAITKIEAPKPKKKTESALKSFISGGVGGVCVVLTGHPLDLIKVKMQVGGASGSVFGMLSNTFRTEGIRGLYRGVSAPLVAVTPIFALSFWGFDMGKRVVSWYEETVNGKTMDGNYTIPQIAVAGGLSGIPTSLVMAPSERVKCLLQVQDAAGSGGKVKYTGMMDCAQQLYRQGGMRSLYKGLGATFLRDVPGSLAWFLTYEVAKKELMRIQGVDSSQLSPVAVMTAGGIAGMACWGVSIPPDVIKSRWQTAPDGQYKGLIDVYRKLVAAEGHGALISGMRPALIRAFPANAACFMGMELSRKALAFMD
eukprot:CAMPEP_0194034554 /NCGR_PEP_ID=MMETSP0009_2-20130614/6964_1 /TAXON_ID=210454 /ORGANISM="Grammatophora oceanica, Strain CCMP 410" /LENGTH=327 /DNA_ID=CAMNT_0038675521 /DNA_START=62 /DNA_END=1045 /DNA_ORIENTATION=+